ncbi:DUF3375 domain-containing protein [Arcticibacter sp. MXS-1]|uniref:DUF3375 domain-containing protein n=1 Tax=Arcticibacter sp. MXS-1 TaxID=3341726 RepID=UPI0035A830CB
MNKEDIEFILKSSISVQIIRLKNSRWVLPFLFSVFKEENRFIIDEGQLIQLLTDRLSSQENSLEDLDEVHIQFGEDELSRSRKHIQNWVEKRILQDIPDPEGNTRYQLSSYTEKVLQWLQSLQVRKHVGTESRFKLLVNSLREIVENTEDDKARRLQMLKERRAELDKEIKAIELGIRPEFYTNSQVQERLDLFNRLCYELIGDFREVEDNFKQIHRSIVEQHTRAEQNKGEILGFAFEAYDALRKSNQGKSFYAFWDFLISRSGQQEWQENTDQLVRMITERNIDADVHFIENVKSVLFRQGRAVYEANDRMAEKLSRIITEKEISRHKRLRTRIGAIKEMVLNLIDRGQIDAGMELDGGLDIRMPIDKMLTYSEKRQSQVVRQPSAAIERVEDFDRFRNLLNTSKVDKKLLWSRVESMLAGKDSVTLREILEQHPPEQGLAEVVSYFDFLRTNPGKVLTMDLTEDIPLNLEKTKYIEIPYLIFSR